MPLLTPSYKQGYYPAIGMPANPGLRKGLQGAWSPNLGPAGVTVRDVSKHGRDALLYTDSAPVEYVTTPQGWAAKLVRSTHHNTIQIPTTLDFANMSIVMTWRPNGADVFGVFTTAVGATNPFAVGFEGTRWRCSNSTSVGRWFSPVETPIIDEIWTIGAYRTAGVTNTSCGIYENGQPFSLTRDATFEVNNEDNGTPGFGTGYGLSYWTDAEVLSCAVWDRVLSDNEFKQLADDPVALTRQADEVFGAAVAAPAGAIMNQFQGSNLGADIFNGTLI